VIPEGETVLKIGWEVAQLLGLGAAAGAMLLVAVPVRPRALGATVLSLRIHEFVGWLTLAAAALHVSLLPAFDHHVVEHLKLTTPLYEWAGILALGALLVLTLPAAAAIRRRLWSRHRNFQALHVVTACLLVALLAVHIVGTSRYVHGRWRSLVYLAIAAVALVALLRARLGADSPQRPPGFLNSLVFGRHGALVLVAVTISLVAVLALAAAGEGLALREPLVGRSAPLPIDLPHEKHRAVACVLCHHNFTDRSGEGSCISCHRSNRADLRAGVEARFHDFCLGCHRDPPANFAHHGPVTQCETCHPIARG
jgi:predicted CXXCH cytochrome family protein